ncbi:MAG: DUF4160 domain-containing protein [Pseudomonadota bacterium]
MNNGSQFFQLDEDHNILFLGVKVGVHERNDGEDMVRICLEYRTRAADGQWFDPLTAFAHSLARLPEYSGSRPRPDTTAQPLVEIQLEPPIVDELAESFREGPIVDAEGHRRIDEELVDTIDSLKVTIQSREHPPPHFHVRFAGENASFRIEDGTRLPRSKGLERYDRNINRWWANNYCKLIQIWNRTRPSDCPVGRIAVPPECM